MCRETSTVACVTGDSWGGGELLVNNNGLGHKDCGSD